MSQLQKENQFPEAAEQTGMFSRGRHALGMVADVVRKKAIDCIEGLGEKAEAERQLVRLAGTGDARSLHALIETGVDPRAPTQSKLGSAAAWTPLHRALANNDEASAFTLVEAIRRRFLPGEASAALNAPEGQYGDSPLMMAAKLGQGHTVHALMAAGADPAQANKEGVTPFMEMCRRGDMEMVKSTMQAMNQGQTSAMLHKVDAHGFNSLFHTVAGSASEDVKIQLLALHASKNFDCAGKYGEDGYSAVHVASLVGQPSMIRELVEKHSGDVNSLSTKSGLTPTMVAGWANQPSSVKMLSTYPELYIDAKRNADDSTALHIAGVRGHHETIAALVECGADLGAKNANNQTPAELAKYLGQNDTAKLLRKLDPHSNENASLTQSLIQRASSALQALKSDARPAPSP